jgi:hypothetical protein
MPKWVNGNGRIMLHRREGLVNEDDRIPLLSRGGFAVIATNRRMYRPCSLISPHATFGSLSRTIRKACQTDPPSLRLGLHQSFQLFSSALDVVSVGLLLTQCILKFSRGRFHIHSLCRCLAHIAIISPVTRGHDLRDDVSR